MYFFFNLLFFYLHFSILYLMSISMYVISQGSEHMAASVGYHEIA